MPVPQNELARHCVWCSQIFWVNTAQLTGQKRGAKFCSLQCSRDARRDVTVKLPPGKTRIRALGYNATRRFADNSPNSYKNRRKGLIEYLGGKCAWCGFSDMRALELDHLKGGGNQARKSIKGGSIKEICELSKKPEDAKKIYQVLCANCNRIKRHVNKEMYRPDRRLSVWNQQVKGELQ